MSRPLPKSNFNNRLFRQSLLFLLALTLLFGSLSLPKTSEASSPSVIPCIVSDTGNNTDRLLIFLSGLNTTHQSSYQFNNIRRELEDLYEGIAYFSYNRDDPQGHYTEHDTGYSIAEHHVPILRAMVETCISSGRFTSIDLVGHSLGGVVAYKYAFSLMEEGDSRLNNIKHVVTMDSPVNGSAVLCVLNVATGPCDLDIQDVILELIRDYLWQQQVSRQAGQEMGQDFLYRPTNIAVATLFAKSIKRQWGTEIFAYTNTNDGVIWTEDAYIPSFGFPDVLGSHAWYDNFGHSTIFRADTVDEVITVLRPVLLNVSYPEEPEPAPTPPVPTGDNSEFVADITLPDGTVIAPGSSHTKIWRIRNTGSHLWGPEHKLAFVGGDRLGAPMEVSLPEIIAPGEMVNIEVPIVAPAEGGNYRGYWQMRNPYGTHFGEEIWVDITVSGGGNPPPPQSNVDLECLNCPVLVAPGEQFRPTIRATLTNLDLRESRGDMLRHSGGELYGAWPHVAVEGTVYNSYDFVFYSDNPITAPSSEGTYESKWRVWRDGDWFGPELTIRFEVRNGGNTNHAPPPPSLIAPSDWAVYQGTIPTLEAQHNGDPDGDPITHYYFDIFESHDTPNSGWITDNSWTPSGLGNYGYQWRVKVRDSRGAESGWSEVRHFNLLDPNPQIYSFTYMWCPAEYGQPDQICFCADTNAGTLRLQVNSATDGSGNGEWQVLNELGVPDYECDTPDDNPPTWTQLEYETGTHLVRLYARREGGWEAAAVADLQISLPSDRRPDAPFNRLPAYDSYVNTRTVYFDWDETLRTTSYRLVASTSPDFSTLLLDIQLPATTSTHTHTFPIDYDTLYWRVTSTGPYGVNESSSRFHIDITPPTSSVASLPETTTDVNFTVNWAGNDSRSGVRWYHVQVRSGDRPDSEWQDWLVNTTQQAAIFQGQAGVEYFFRVRAMDNIGNWEGWPGVNGDTSTVVDPTALPPTPWWDDEYAFKRNLTLLNNDSDPLPENYPIHLHFDGTTSPTALEIYEGSLAIVKGDDIRIVHENVTELDRFVQQFTPEAIDIWFPLQASLGGGQSNSGVYQMYFGNSNADSPIVDINAVFVPEADGNTMGLWHFQEGSGTTVTDSSGRGHDGTFNNAGWTDGYLGRAGQFNGTNAVVNLGNPSDFNNITAMTLEAWINLTGSAGGHPLIIVKGIDGFGQYSVKLNGDRNVEFSVGADGGNQSVSSNMQLEPNRWYHIAAVHDGGTNQWIYVNGIQRGHNSNSRPALVRDYPLYLGFAPWWNGTAFPGNIQHVRISNIARHSFPYGQVDIPSTVGAGVPLTPPIEGNADLVLLNVSATSTGDGNTIVQAIVYNAGDRATGNSFFTDLYLDHIPTGPGDLTGSVRLWFNQSIEPEAVIELTTVLTDEVLFQESSLLAPMQELTHTLYAQADSAGLITEPDNQDNIFTSGEVVCFASPDAFESDNTPQSASTLTIGQPQDHNIHTEGDVDWSRTNLVAGQTYTLKTQNLGYTADTVLSLFASNGTTLLAENDDSTDTLASTLTWTPTTSGIYFLRVRQWNTATSGCGSTYQMLVSQSGGSSPTPTVAGSVTPTPNGGPSSTPVATITPTPNGGPSATPVATVTPTPIGGPTTKKLFLPVIRQR